MKMTNKYLCSEHAACDTIACIHKFKHVLKESCRADECSDNSEAQCIIVELSKKEAKNERENERAIEDIELVKKFVGLIS